MRDLTDAELSSVQGDIFRGVQRAERAALLTFANAVLKRFGESCCQRDHRPLDERAILERERKAWDAAQLWMWGRHFPETPTDFEVLSKRADAARDRRYPLPSPEPTPVLTDQEIAALHTGTGKFCGIPFGRAVQQEVLRRLAERKP